MQSALKLAEKGISSVEPNPAVGCVIVKAGQVIGKGYHKKFGGPHAEVNAIEDCRTIGVTPEGGTLYVTLEPCCHQGKTGPCTEAIINAKIARVVAATVDPSEHANGKGLEQLRQAGIEVEVGLCETGGTPAQCAFLQARDDGPMLGRAQVGPKPRRQAGLRGSVVRETLDHERGQPKRRPQAASPGRRDPGGDQHGSGGRSAAHAPAEPGPQAPAHRAGRSAPNPARMPALADDQD